MNVLIEPIQWLSKSISEFGPIGKGLTATLLTVFGVGGSLISSAISGAFKNLKVKAADFGSRLVGGAADVASPSTIPGGTPDAGRGGFMDKLLKVNPKQLLALGGAFVLIGTGVAIAAAGLSKFVGAFKDLSPEQTEAANSALLGFGVALGTVMVGLLAFSAMAPALGNGVGS